MRTAGLLIALSALAVATVHAGADQDPVVVKPAPTEPVQTKEPVKPEPTSKEPVETKEPPKPEPTTKEPVETKEPPKPEPTTKEPVETKEPPKPEPTTKDPETKVPPTPMPPTPTPTPWPTQPNTTCNVLENKDRLGFDLANTKGDLKSCDGACEKNPGCQTWTWNDYNGGTCWLKSYASSLVDKKGVWATECVVDRPPQVCRTYKDIDFVGMDIGNKPGKSFGDCCEICTAFPGCTAYAWNSYNGGTCWLKKSVGHVIANPGVISSSTVQLWGPVCPFEYDTDFEGKDIGNKPAKDAGVCCSQCKENKDCKAYSWSNYNGGTCWMKSGKGKTIKAAGVISAALAGF